MLKGMAKRGRHVRLQPVDWKWLSALEVYGVLGLGQLNGLALKQGGDPETSLRLFFNETVKRDHWKGRSRRVVKLAKNGYLAAHQLPYRPVIFTLADKGHEALKEAGLARLAGFRHRISESLANHELTTNAVGLVLTELMGLEVLTARERMEWKREGGRPPIESRTISDLWIAEDNEPKAVEIERNPKAKDEYKDRWHFYKLNLPPKGVVLYITTWPGGKRFILELAADYRADFVLVCDLAEFRESRGQSRFIGYVPGRSMVLKPRLSVPLAVPASQRVPPASPPARQDVSAGGGLAAGPSAAPTQFIRIGELIRPRGRPDQFASPLESGTGPRPHPPAPSPSPEGEQTAQTTANHGGHDR